MFNTSTHLLLAVSGGIDSVVLCHLIHSAGYRFEIAHCNFHLRGADSDRDEAFVRRLADRYGVPCHVAGFDTRQYAAEQHLSIEDAARQLRYRFFAQVLEQSSNPTIQQSSNPAIEQSHNSAFKHSSIQAFQHSLVLTAHHRDDSVETFFLNLLRGTGIAGLVGIRPTSRLSFTTPPITVVHPLLPFSREEIVQYAETHGLDHVEDATNASLEYRRNRVRHELMPLLRSLSPVADKSVEQAMRHLADTETIYRQAIEAVREKVVRHQPDGDLWDLDQLRVLQPLRTWLFELLRPYGFNAAQIGDIQSSLDGPSGRCFYSATHRLVRERSAWVVTPLQSEGQETPAYRMQEWSQEAYLQRFGSFRTAADRALFDADQLRQPLHLRHWRSGDRFQPYGMKGSRLLSDFFSDLKLSLRERESQWLLCDADDQILWVIGRRADGRCAVTDATRTLVSITTAE